VIRQAPRVDPNKTTTVSIDALDYLPTDDYWSLGHNEHWGNASYSPASKALFEFEEDGNTYAASCTLRSARNAGISITGQVPAELTSLMRARAKFFSAYIPGISGIPNREEKRSRKVVLRACSYGDSNVILRNVLLLLKISDQLSALEDWLSQLIGPIKIFVEHVDDADLVVRSWVRLNGLDRPLELVGTGYLQLIQIFSYVLVFDPGILLLDEPDIHLHPSVQEKLVRSLARVAEERRLRVLLTTHSPFIVRAAPPAANVYWVKDGKLEETARSQVELALGWGVFGKKVLIVSEDQDVSLLRKLVSQWPQIDGFVAFYPGTGYNELPTPSQAHRISEALGGKFKILVHRDRDSLTDEEARKLSSSYESAGVSLWLPAESDVEAYYCHPQFIAATTGISETDANAHLEDILRKQATPIADQFASQRAAHNAELNKAGGSLANDVVWQQLQSRPLRGAKGKTIFKQLKNKLGPKKFSEANFTAYNATAPEAEDLKIQLETLLGEV
jgi:energy-coupling factor transporter ATP-binding protein EcfA2